MPSVLVALWLLATPATAAPPPLEPLKEGEVMLSVPTGWKALVKADVHNVTLSKGLATTVTLYWYDLQKGVTNDILMNVLIDTVNDTLPIGQAKELDRAPLPGFEHPKDLQRGMQMNAEVTAGVGPIAYTMKVGAVTLIDEPAQRVIAAFVVAPPEEYAAIDALPTLGAIVTSLHLATDPLLPIPSWWWNATPPEAIAMAPADDAASVAAE